MNRTSDRFPGISGRRLCELAGVKPQTRDSWAGRGLLETRKHYVRSDLIDVLVLAALLSNLPKGEAPIAWQQIRTGLRGTITQAESAVVWDRRARRAVLARGAAAIGRAALASQTTTVIAVGASIVAARDAYAAEVDAWRRRRAATAQRRRKRGAA